MELVTEVVVEFVDVEVVVVELVADVVEELVDVDAVVVVVFVVVATFP